MKKDEEIRRLKQQIEALTNNWKRALADYQNLEKRTASEKEEFLKFANSSLILKLLSVLDVLEKVQSHLKDKGLDLAILEFKRVLENEGVGEIEVRLGDNFNQDMMECVEVIKGEKENQVAEVMSKGYKLNGKLLRPVKVKVYK